MKKRGHDDRNAKTRFDDQRGNYDAFRKIEEKEAGHCTIPLAPLSMILK
jgi:hypothetical protein